MPLIRIDLPEGVSNDDKEKIQKKVREVVLKTLAPKQVRYDYVSIRESFGIIGDGLPVVDVDLRPGREPERKKGLVAGISSVVKDILDIDLREKIILFPLIAIVILIGIFPNIFLDPMRLPIEIIINNYEIANG